MKQKLEFYGKEYKKKGTQKRAYTTAICFCGKHFEALLDNVKRGVTGSCGCQKGEKHDYYNTSTYKSWQGLKERCDNKNNDAYYRYGGRGISYDPRWSKFTKFLEDMGECPVGMSIERVNNDGNYTKENCRWATKTEQANNRRTNVFLKYKGKSDTLANWCRNLGINYKYSWKLIRSNGMSLEEVYKKLS